MPQQVNSPDETVRVEMILVSAYFHTRPPVGYPTANCERVLYHALVAASCWDETLEKNRAGVFQGVINCPVIDDWYRTLIALVTHEPASERLLDGAGNFGEGRLSEAAAPTFTACWLTPAGYSKAEELLAQNPEWRTRLGGA